MSSPKPTVGTITPTSSSQARFFASQIASWYLATLDPHSPHARNIESRLRHPVHVVTRRILYGEVEVESNSDLENVFNEDDVEKRGELSRRSAARMEAFLASCSVAVREDEGEEKKEDGKLNRARTGSFPKGFRQIDQGDLMHRLELYCRT